MHPIRLRNVAITLLLLLVAACAPTRYESFTPQGSNQAWALTADKSIGGTITIKVDNQPLIAGQAPIFGSREYAGDYEGHKIKLALTKENLTAQGDEGFRAIVMVDNTVAARFNW